MFVNPVDYLLDSVTHEAKVIDFLGYGIRHWLISENWRRALSAMVPRAMMILFLTLDIFIVV
jgi:hypothetical protein